MLGFLCSDYDVGIYSAASKIHSLVKNVLAAVLVVSIPRLSWLIGTGDKEKYRETLTKIFNVTMLLALPAVTGLLSLSEAVIRLVAGEAYLDAVAPLRILTITLFACLVGWIYNQCVLLPTKKDKAILTATVVSALVNVALNFVLLPRYKSSAAAFTTLIAESCQMAISIWHGRKDGRLNKGWLRNLAAAMAGCLVIAAESGRIKALALSPALTLLICVPLGVISYAAVLLLLRNKIALEYTSLFLKKLKQRVC